MGHVHLNLMKNSMTHQPLVGPYIVLRRLAKPEIGQVKIDEEMSMSQAT